MDNFGWDNNNIRRLDISDLERIARFRRAGYGGSVSDCMNSLGVRGTVLSDRFRPLRQGIDVYKRQRLPHPPKESTYPPGID